MTLIDLSYIIQWWFLWLVIGILFLPLTSIIFSNFFDKSYIFSRVLGILMISYSVWIISSLKILTFQTLNIAIICFVFLIINLFLLFKFKLIHAFKILWKIFLFEEVLFLAALLFWSFIRAHEPSIHGLEKFMDFGFVNSILRSDYFPPK